MNCTKRDGHIALYAGGDLPPCAAHKLERHLEQCGQCRTRLDGMRAMRNSIHEPDGTGFERTELDAFRRDFSARLAQVRTEETRSRFHWRRIAYATAASLLLAGVAGFGAFHTSQAGGLDPARPVDNVTQSATVPAKPSGKASEPITVRIATDNPNLVIYWLTDSPSDIS